MLRRVSWLFVVVLLAGAAVMVAGLRPQLPPAERGRRLAELLGCPGCHGPGGIKGAANPGRKDRTVPTYGGDLMMYAKSRDEVVEWIRDGVTQARRQSRTWRAERDRGALRMPAFGGRISPQQLSDLADFVRATAGEPAPDDSLAQAGLERAEVLGCVGCHGPGGRFARPNPGSLKGYIPAWDGGDFPELVRDRGEFEQWVDAGISDRFERNPLARYFLRRAAVVMPGYRTRLEAGDIDALWAYAQWLRREAGK